MVKYLKRRTSSDWLKGDVKDLLWLQFITDENHCQKNNLKGPVKCVRRNNVTQNFNLNGNMTETVDYKNGRIFCKSTYIYDKSDNLIEIADRYANGRIKRTMISYDIQNSPLIYSEYNSNGRLVDRVSFESEYDENGNIISSKCYDMSGLEIDHYNYIYDNYGRMMKRCNKKCKTTYHYKDDGCKTIKVLYYADKLMSTMNCNSLGKIEENKCDDGSGYNSTSEYDEFGNKIVTHSYWEGQLISHFIKQYSYDKYNNWITYKHCERGETKIIERQIEYY